MDGNDVLVRLIESGRHLCVCRRRWRRGKCAEAIGRNGDHLESGGLGDGEWAHVAFGAGGGRPAVGSVVHDGAAGFVAEFDGNGPGYMPDLTEIFGVAVMATAGAASCAASEEDCISRIIWALAS